MSKKNYVPDRKGSAHAHRAGKIAIAIIVLLLIGALVASVLTLGFTSFDLKKNFGKEEEPPIAEAEEDTFIIEPVSSELVKIMPLTMAASPDMAAEEHTVRLTATVLPEGAPQEVKWTIAFTNPASEWAMGKNVDDYVTLTKVQTEDMTDDEKAHPYIVDVKGLQAFREQITITVASLHNEKAAATCLVDYAARYEGFNQIIMILSDKYQKHQTTKISGFLVMIYMKISIFFLMPSCLIVIKQKSNGCINKTAILKSLLTSSLYG